MELVVLLAEDGTAIGTMPKAEVHTADTPLHLAFSCYLFDQQGRVLLTRRALSKRTWPGVWTNSYCGHPAPSESIEEAIRRRAQQELGCTVTAIEPALPSFRYRAIDASGVVENEICPVYTAVVDADLHPNPAEVAEWRWVTLDDVASAAAATPFAFSPWLVEQVAQLQPQTVST